MALPAGAVIEVRTTGSDTQCAGGFNSARGGTDYSQQDTAQATGTVTVSGTTCTATTGIFTSAMVGNYITDGTSWREITAYTSSTVVTLDSTVSWTSATIYVGGAMKSPALVETIVVAGNDVYYKAGTYSISSSSANVANGRLNLNVSGGADTRIRRIGYSTNRTPGNSDTRPVLQATVSIAGYIVTFNNANSFNSMENVIVDANSQTNTTCLTGQGRCNYADNCKFINGNSSSNHCVTITNNFCLERFEVTGFSPNGGSTSALETGSAGAVCFDGVVHDNSSLGVRSDGTVTMAFVNSYNQTGTNGYGFYHVATGCVFYLNCNAYNNSKDGFVLNTAAGFLVATNCIAVSNAGYGFNPSINTYQSFCLYNCAGYNNTSGNYPTGASAQPQTIQNFQALTASPFTNAGSGDFSLNNTASAGAACRAAGIPGVFPGGLTTGHLDIGAAQHQDAGAGGGVALRSPIMANTLIYEE